jgi:ubiquinone/menaquinone biosynthesis C-methylase UbiE
VTSPRQSWQKYRKLMNLYEFGLSGLDLKSKVVLDCAIGAGESTYYWAREIDRQGGTSMIIGCDLSLNDDDRMVIQNNLKEFSKYVQLRELDITELSTISSNSIDYINCDDTLVFLALTVGKLEKTVRGFYRVLKGKGIIVINSEIPMEYSEIPFEQNQVRRWNLAKAIYALNGEVWSSEPGYPEVKSLLQNNGFEIIDEMQQKPFKQANANDCLLEWENIMNRKINGLRVSHELKRELTNEVVRIKEAVIDNGMACPGYYSIKSQKKIA